MTASLSPVTEQHPYLSEAVPRAGRERRHNGFFTIDNDIVRSYGAVLGAYGLAVYMVLKSFANKDGECFPSQTTIAEMAGMSRMQVSREITKLKDLGLVDVKPRYGKHGGQRSNLYILTGQGGVTDSDTPCNRELQPPVTEGDTPCNSQVHRNNTYTNNTQNEQDLHQQTRSRRRTHELQTAVSETNKAVVVALTDVGMSNKVAQFLASKYSEERITEKIAYLEFVQDVAPEVIKSPCGWLRTAIVDDFAQPDGFVSVEERKQQDAVETQKVQEEAEQAQARAEESLAFQEKKTAAQEARRQALTEQYGTTEADFVFWEQAQWEIKYTTPAHIAALTADMDVLKVTETAVVVGVEREDVWRQLQHPNIQMAINRAVGSVAGSDVRLVVEEIKTVGLI